MGDAGHARFAGRRALNIVTGTRQDVRLRGRVASDVVVVVALGLIVIAAAAFRREFLGDGVRHLPAILSDQIQAGEPRWLLFPAAAHLWVRMLSSMHLVAGAESALSALVGLSVLSGISFLCSLRVWLCAECEEERRRAAALLLAGSCAPFLILFTDIAEPQIAAAIVAAGLAFARTRRDDPTRAAFASICAICAIAIGSLIYQGTILAVGMLPLVLSAKTVARQRSILTTVVALTAVVATMIAVQMAHGAPMIVAAKTVVQGENNPLMRSLMASHSLAKYAVAALAGPPQGMVALDNYGGLRALGAALVSSDRSVAASGIVNLVLLLLGSSITAVLLIRAIRDRRWPVLAAAAILLTLPVVRNQQYAYVKFYVLWPIPVALVGLRFHARSAVTIAMIVIVANGWLLAHEIRSGRDDYRVAKTAYATATASTCWVTSGWSPPFPYLWPGTAVPILGTLATGTQPPVQRTALSAALQRCFCESERVWTDTTRHDSQIVTSIADHFDYRAIDLPSVLVEPSGSHDVPMRGVFEYSDSARQRACRALRSDRRQTGVRPEPNRF
jgi:hypothetical protein